jgi:phosphate-selective porin OprO/OprP
MAILIKPIVFGRCVFLLFSFLFVSFAFGQSSGVEIGSRTDTDVNSTDGLLFESHNRQFSMRIGFRIQTRASVDDFDSDSASRDVVEMQVRRSRLRLNGYLLGPQLKYTIQLSFSRGDQDWDNVPFPNVLRDANVTWEWMKGQRLIFGLRKLPGNRQRVVSSGSQEFVDRALTNATFNIDRDAGIQSWHQFNSEKPVWVKLALTSGEGRNQRSPNTGVSTTARVEWLPLGNFKDEGDYFEGDLAFESESRLSFGAVYNINRNTSRTGGQIGSIMNGGATRNIETWMTDGLWKRQGWSVAYEAFLRRARDPIVNATQNIYVGRGFNIQTTYVFPSMWSPGLRWTWITPESRFETSLDERTQTTFAITRYIKEHNIKVQADLTSEKVSARGANSAQDNMYYRVQLELGI